MGGDCPDPLSLECFDSMAVVRQKVVRSKLIIAPSSTCLKLVLETRCGRLLHVLKWNALQNAAKRQIAPSSLCDHVDQKGTPNPETRDQKESKNDQNTLRSKTSTKPLDYMFLTRYQHGRNLNSHYRGQTLLNSVNSLYRQP